MKKPIIAIDGPAAAGKGTLAKNIAKELNYNLLDTGALYRATAFIALKHNIDLDNPTLTAKAAQMLYDEIMSSNNPQIIFDNPALRNDETGQAASKCAANQAVRTTLKGLQQNFAKEPGDDYNGAILDGRDIGTVICPDATIKLFITANTEVRADRRYKELQNKGLSVTRDAVLRDMRERDERDSQRSAAPLKPADDAVIIDTSDLDANQAFEKAMEIIAKALN